MWKQFLFGWLLFFSINNNVNASVIHYQHQRHLRFDPKVSAVEHRDGILFVPSIICTGQRIECEGLKLVEYIDCTADWRNTNLPWECIVISHHNIDIK